MTSFAFSRRRLVEEHGLPIHLAGDFVTIVTSDIPVSTLERKRSALVVVKLRGLPACRIMATRTVGGVFTSGKLAGVGIVVTSRAVFRRGTIIDIFQTGLQGRRTMAVGAGYAAVSAEKGKFRFRMVKAVEFFPVCRRVAGFASCHRAVRALRLHLLPELPSVRILVTCRAGTVVEKVFHGCCRTNGNWLVAIHAEDRSVPAGKGKARLFVPG